MPLEKECLHFSAVATIGGLVERYDTMGVRLWLNSWSLLKMFHNCTSIMRKNILNVSTYLIAAVFFSCLLYVSDGAAEQIGCFSRGWPSERSDLEPDPDISRGTLPNGMRYVIYPNNEPEDRVAMYLNIKAGSFHETDDQRGVAHFLEHMLFNGTTHFPPGELVKFFQSIGMSFGGDTNAHTSFDETVYKIMLPDGSEKNLRKGLLVLSDFGRGALLTESEIDRERGVILSEKLARDSASYRTFVSTNRFFMRGTLMPERLVIGEERVLQSADQALLKNYYDSWYRPDNMVLVIVGDTDAATITPLVDKYFGSLAGSGISPQCPDFGQVQHEGLESFYHYEPDLGRTDVTIQSRWNLSPRDDSLQLQIEGLYRYAGILIMQDRLQRLMEQESTPFTDAGYSSGELFQQVGYAAISARTEGEKCAETQRKLHKMLKQALEYGFMQEELDVVKKDLLSSLESSVLTTKSRKSSSIAMEIIRQFNENRVFQSPEQELDLYGEIVQGMTLEHVQSQFRKSWEHDVRVVSVTGNARLEEIEGRQLLKTIFLETEKENVRPPVAREKKIFPYLDVPQVRNNGVTERFSLPQVNGERMVLSNNVILSLKSTDFEPNKIRIVVSVGEGKFSEPAPGASLLAEEVMNDSGTNYLSRTEFHDILAGSTLDVKFSITGDSFRYQGSGVSKDSELLMQVLYTLLQDPALREEAYVRSIKSLHQMYERLDKDIQGALRSEVESFLAGGDPRVGLPSWQAVSSVELSQVRAWLLPALRNGSMEISIVGDFDVTEMGELAARYFGALGERERSGVEHTTLNFPEGRHLVEEVPSEIEKTAVLVAWPTADIWDIERTRRLNVLSGIFRERLRKVVREKLGATYSPVVYSAPSKMYRNYGKLVAQVIVAPGKEKDVLEAILAIGKDLNRGTVSPDELENVRKPLMTSLKESVKSNRYWLYSVLDQSVRYPRKLEWATTMMKDYALISVEEINSLAREYLIPHKSAKVVVKPVPERKMSKE